MTITSGHVDEAKIAQARAILSAGSAQGTIDTSLEIVVVLHQHKVVLVEMKGNPRTEEHRSATIIGYAQRAGAWMEASVSALRLYIIDASAWFDCGPVPGSPTALTRSRAGWSFPEPRRGIRSAHSHI